MERMLSGLLCAKYLLSNIEYFYYSYSPPNICLGITCRELC